MSLLQGIMSYPSFNMRSSLLPQILKLEEHYVQYERLGGKLSQDMKSAVLLRAVSGQMKTHLNLTLNEGSSYGKIREAIIAFDTATTKWNESGALTFSGVSPTATDPNGVMPMEIDRIKGDGKKGKGKSKDQKGKSKGKDDRSKSKGKGGKSSGKEGKGKGGGGKEGKGGKGKNPSEVCWTCGKPSHMAKDCPAIQSIAGSHTTSPSTTLTTSSTSGGGGENSTAKNIRRVSQPVIFDLREGSDAGSIRMVSQVEFFNIASDDENEYDGYMANTVVETDNEEVNLELYEEGGERHSVKVIVDSGADASIFPGKFLESTLSSRALQEAPQLQDAQGKKIKSYGNKDVDIMMMTSSGQAVVLKEKVTFSDMVSQPILSFGRLMRSGWSIDGQKSCLKNGSLEVPLAFQNQSLVVDASIRVITEPMVIRTLGVKLGDELANMANSGYGWKKKEEFWVGLHLSTKFQSPQFIPGFRDQGEGFCRSTLVERSGGWELVEMAEPLDGLEEQEEEIEELREVGLSKVMTFVAPEGTVPEVFGFEIDSAVQLGPKQDMEELAIPQAGDEELEDIGGAELPGGEGGEQGRDLDDQMVQYEVGVAVPEEIRVNDVTLTLESPLRSLRAACAFYQIGQSGGKQKCFSRLVAHQGALELMMARDLAARGQAMSQRIPLEQVAAKLPTEAERKAHELTHVPYASWCPACIKHRARPDQRRRSGKSHDQGYPTISFDFCKVKAKGSEALGAEEEDQAQEGVHDGESGALWLIAVCSETGSLLGLPLKSKNQMNLITHELLAFTQVLGHEAAQYYCDNEPPARQIVRLLVSSRTAMGLKTTMRTTKLYDSAGNSLAENAVHRVRGLAASMMESLAEKIGLRFHHQHPLWSWACRHAAWTLNRYQVLRGTTSFELTHGKAYDGKMCPFGEVVFAYSKQKQGFKADPRWKVGICLGKTEVQDAWVIGDGNRVFLSRSLRRVADASTRYVACYQAFTAYSWEFQQNFGGRIVPSKRVATMVGGPLLGLPTAETKGIALDDDDAREIIAFSKSYAGKLEEVKDLVEVAQRKPGEQEVLTEEQKLAEEKKQDYVEEKIVIPETRAQDAHSIDEARNQAGPSMPMSTPRSSAQKMSLEVDGGEEDSKRLKVTPVKPVHESEGEMSEPKRLRTSGGSSQMERRVEATAVGQDTYYHMDQFFGEEEILACGEEEEEEEVSQKVSIPEELWSSASLERVPPDPPFWIDDF